MMPHSGLSSINIKAYENVEDLTLFDNTDEINRYRVERLTAVSEPVTFIENQFSAELPFVALDVGSGSSCLLYALSKRGFLSRGVGIDSSPARHHFAEEWKIQAGYTEIDNILGDIRSSNFALNQFNICTVLDNTLAYLFDKNNSHPSKIVDKISGTLVGNGILLIEVSVIPSIIAECIKNGSVTKTKKNKKSDRFKSTIYNYHWDEARELMKVQSRYQYRESGDIIDKLEFFKVYNANDMKDLIAPNFEFAGIWSDFSGKEYIQGKSEKMIIAGRKRI